MTKKIRPETMQRSVLGPLYLFLPSVNVRALKNDVCTCLLNEKEGRCGQEKTIGKAEDVQERGRHKAVQGSTRQYKAI